jgi:hypothetical protein
LSELKTPGTHVFHAATGSGGCIRNAGRHDSLRPYRWRQRWAVM